MSTVPRAFLSLGGVLPAMCLLAIPAAATSTEGDPGASRALDAPATVEICLTSATPQEGVREVTCTLTATVDLGEREVCITGGECEGDGIKITIELDEPICGKFE